MRVLVAYDGSASARAALRATAELLPSAEAVVLTVYEAPVRLEHLLAAHGPTPSPLEGDVADLRRRLQDEALAVAREGAALAAAAGLAATAETAATTGSARDPHRGDKTRVRSARLRHARTRRPVARLLGSTSSALLHHATLPILVVPERSPEPTGPVLLAYDGSEPARTAVTTAAQLFPSRPAVVIHAWESSLRHSLAGHALSALPITDIAEPQASIQTDVIGLFVCWGTFPVPWPRRSGSWRPGAHPCKQAFDALKEAGHSPDVVKSCGLAPLPDVTRVVGRSSGDR